MEINELISKIMSECSNTGMKVKVYDTATDKHYDVDSVEFVPTLKQLDIEISTDAN